MGAPLQPPNHHFGADSRHVSLFGGCQNGPECVRDGKARTPFGECDIVILYLYFLAK